MDFIVTTSKSVLLVDISQNYIRPIHRGSGVYFGIAYDGVSNYFISARNRLTYDEFGRDFNLNCILVFDKKLKYLYSLIPTLPMKDVHGICYHNNKLFITNTHYNNILIYHFTKNEWEIWKPEGLSDSNEDINHINYIRIFDDRIYLSCHNFGDSDIYEYDYDNTRRLISSYRIGEHIHDLFYYNGCIYTNSSNTGELLCLNDIKFCKTVCDSQKYYNRGLYLSDKVNVIGLTQKCDERYRDESDSHLLVFDKKFNLLKTIDIKNQGMILDICIYN